MIDLMSKLEPNNIRTIDKGSEGEELLISGVNETSLIVGEVSDYG